MGNQDEIFLSSLRILIILFDKIYSGCFFRFFLADVSVIVTESRNWNHYLLEIAFFYLQLAELKQGNQAVS